MVLPQTTSWSVDLYIGTSDTNLGGERFTGGRRRSGLNAVQKFEVVSFINHGTMIRAKVESPDLQLNAIFDDEYLMNARKLDQPTLVRYRVKWAEGDESIAKWQTAILTDIHTNGKAARGASFEFIAIDPITFFVTQGSASGRVYKGRVGTTEVNGRKIKGVIEQVLDDYVPDKITLSVPQGRQDIDGNRRVFNIKKFVSATTDAPHRYHMMRQDPKTFIMSMLDWSADFLADTNSESTSWIINYGEDVDERGQVTLSINIEESYAPWLRSRPFKDQTKTIILRYGGTNDQKLRDIIKWEFLASPFVSVINTRLATSGISAISGQYLDITNANESDEVFVDDTNTGNKSNPRIDISRGFAKPEIINRGSTIGGLGTTYIPSVPEFSAGELGRKYGQYITGRSRQTYFNMINLVSRLKITSRGVPDLFDPTELGKSFVNVQFQRPQVSAEDVNLRTLFDGNWLLYGWNHRLTRLNGNWETDLYVSRFDYDANAIPGPLGNA